MKRFTPAVPLAVLALTCGCGSPARVGTSPNPRYNPRSAEQREDRIAELERAGHTHEGAERKARKEFARDAWQTDHSQAWAAERTRAERSARREKMEEDLASLPKKP